MVRRSPSWYEPFFRYANYLLVLYSDITLNSGGSANVHCDIGVHGASGGHRVGSALDALYDRVGDLETQFAALRVNVTGKSCVCVCVKNALFACTLYAIASLCV
jgi:hypothetical protein